MSDWEELEPVGPHLAERVLATVRRRRRALGVATATVVVAGGVVTGVWVLPPDRGRPATVARAAAAAEPDDRALAYLAAIGAERRGVYVSAPLPAAVRREIERHAGDRVHFGLGPRGATSRPVIVLGVLRLRGDHAEVARDNLCGALCGSGSTVWLVRRDGVWKVTRRTGPDWVDWAGVSHRPAS